MPLSNLDLTDKVLDQLTTRLILSHIDSIKDNSLSHTEVWLFLKRVIDISTNSTIKSYIKIINRFQPKYDCKAKLYLTNQSLKEPK